MTRRLPRGVLVLPGRAARAAAGIALCKTGDQMRQIDSKHCTVLICHTHESTTTIPIYTQRSKYDMHANNQQSQIEDVTF